jgi:hypothetical protein
MIGRSRTGEMSHKYAECGWPSGVSMLNDLLVAPISVRKYLPIWSALTSGNRITEGEQVR